MLTQAYMQNAFMVTTMVAVLAGVVGFFVVLRAASFATHSLAQIGFAGAAGAVLLGLDPMLGLLSFALAGAVGIGVLGVRDSHRDSATALVMTAALGIGALFLVLNSSYATAAFTLLFGSIVGISRIEVLETAGLVVITLCGLALIFRPLLFSTTNHDAALARGVPLYRLNIAFLACVAVATATTIPVVGTLLIFALLVAPPAAGILLGKKPSTAILIGIALNLACCWIGIIIAYETGLPIGFTIAMLAALTYVGARIYRERIRSRRGRGTRLVVAPISLPSQEASEQAR